MPRPRMRLSRLWCLGALVAIALNALPLTAHELPSGVGTQTAFFFHPDHLEIELNFGISKVESWNYLERIDTDGNGTVSEEESLAFIDAWGPKLIQAMDVNVNGFRPATFDIVERWEAGIRGRLLTKSLDAFYKIRCSLPPELPTGGWWLHYRDTTFMTQESTQICWVRQLGQDEAFSFWIFDPTPMPSWGGDFQMYGRGATIFFDDEFRGDIQPGKTKIPFASELRNLDYTAVPREPEAPPNDAPSEAVTATDTATPERTDGNTIMRWASIGAIVTGLLALAIEWRRRARTRE